MVSALSRPVLAVALAAITAGGFLVGPTTARAQSASVVIQNFSFMPPSMTVGVGTTVTWMNGDSVAHTSTADAGGWNSGPISPGGTFQHTFNAAGTFTYHCTIHPSMHGSIVVQSGGTQPSPAATGRSITVTPNPVTVGSSASVQGAGFTANNRAFVFWRRPDGTSRGIWLRTSPTGTFSLVLRFAPIHGIGTERIAAFDAATRTWTPFSAVSVVPRGTGPEVLSASVNPVANGRATIISGRGFTPRGIVVVQWRRPDGSMATLRVRANGAGAFAFQLVADPRHGCGTRTFTGLDAASLLAAPPLSLGELC